MDPRKEHAVQRGRYPHPNLGRVTSAVTRGTMRRGCQIPCCVLCSPSLDHLSRPKTHNWKYPPLEETLQLSESASRQGVLLQVLSWGEEGDVLGQNHKLIFFHWHLRRTVLLRRWCSAEQPDCCWWTSKQGVKTSSSSSSSAFCTRVFPINQEPQGMSNQLLGTADLAIFLVPFHIAWSEPQEQQRHSRRSVRCTAATAPRIRTSARLTAKRCHGETWRKGISLLCAF